MELKMQYDEDTGYSTYPEIFYKDSPLTAEEGKSMLDFISKNAQDEDMDHRVADGILLRVLAGLGHPEFEDKFDAIDKWYA